MAGDPTPSQQETTSSSGVSRCQRVESCLQKPPEPAPSSLSSRAPHCRAATAARGSACVPLPVGWPSATVQRGPGHQLRISNHYRYIAELPPTSSDRWFEIPELRQTISFGSQGKNFAPRFAGLYVRGANRLLKIQYKESLADGSYFETLHCPTVWTKALNSDGLKEGFFSGAYMSLGPGSARNQLVRYNWSEHKFGYRPQRRPPQPLPSGRFFLNPNSDELMCTLLYSQYI